MKSTCCNCGQVILGSALNFCPWCGSDRFIREGSELQEPLTPSHRWWSPINFTAKGNVITFEGETT